MQGTNPRIATTLLAAAATLAVAGGAHAADTYDVDKGHSAVVFKALHFGIGYTYGVFRDFGGKLTVDEADPAKSAIELEVKVGSVDTFDDKRNKDLLGPDFFNVKQFPSMKFRSTKVEKAGADLKVTGDLTLHGVTKPVTTTIKKVGAGKDPWGNTRIGYETSFEIARSDFGMKHGEPAASDKVWLTIALEGARK
jgi:polyisoprenoid-binding protein YceI